MANLTTAANAVEQVVSSDVVRGIFTNDEVFGLLEQTESGGDSAYRWNLMTSGIVGAAAVEGDAFIAADSNAYSRPVLSYRLYQATFEITDHLKAALKNNQAAYFDAITRETQEAIAGVKDAVSMQWLGSAGEGLLLAIDNTGTYAGLAHNTTTGWDSLEDSTSAVLSYPMLDDEFEGLRDNERRGRPNMILAPENQITNYTRLSGPGVRDGFQHMIVNGEMPRVDLGADVYRQTYRGCPWVGLPDLNDNTILIVQREKLKIIYHERTPGDKGWAMEEISRGGHTQQINVSWFGLLVVEDPFRCGKLSAVTA